MMRIFQNDELRGCVEDSGLIEYYIRKYIQAKYLYPTKERDAPPAPLTLMHFLGAFIILASLGILSTLIFVAELFREARVFN